MGKLLISHRSTIYPCFIPDLGEFDRSWSYKTYPLQKYKIFQMPDKKPSDFILLLHLCTFALHENHLNPLNPDNMENKNVLLNESVKAGLIIGAVGIFVFLIEYVADFKPVGIVRPMLMMLIALGITITMLVIYLKKYRAALGGFISFRDAFLFSLITLVVSGIMYTLFTFLFMQLFDPEYMKNMMQAQKDWMETYLSGKMPEDKIQEQLDKIELQMSKPALIQSLTSLGYTTVFSAIAALIVGAIMKKKPNVFDDGASGGVI